MTTKVHSYLGGLGIDATNKLTLAANATVTVGNGTATGNVHVGGNMSIGNISPAAHDLAIAGSALIAGDLTLSAGGDGALQFPVASSIKVLDNSATSLVIEEADTAYVTIVTTDGSEAIKFDKALDINASANIDATVTVGVKIEGDTAGAHLLWDSSANKLSTAGDTTIDIVKDKLLIGSTAVTTTAAELNLLDNVSGLVQADFTKLAAIDSSATEINLLDAITRGSIIYGNASAASARLAKGAEGTVLTAGASDISWAALEAGVGYQNSSTSTVPGTANTDLGNLTDASEDAFGIASTTKYDLMDPIGSIVSLDLGAL